MNKLIILKISHAIELAAAWYQIDPDMLRAICWQESQWGSLGDNTHIQSFDGGFGRGIFQIDARFHPFSATFVENEEGSSLRVQNEAAYDVLLNTMYAAWLLIGKYRLAGSWEKAIERYNGTGPAARQYAKTVKKWMTEKPWKAYLG